MNIMTRPRLPYLALTVASFLCKRSSATFLHHHHPQRTQMDLSWNHVPHPKHSRQHSSRDDLYRNNQIHQLQLVSRSRDDDNDDDIRSPRTDQPQPISHAGTVEKKSPLFWSDTVRPIAVAVVQSFLLALVLLTWEDYTCVHTLPSRNRVDLPVSSSWGVSTVKGMGFGRDQRLILQQRQIDITDTTADSTDDDLWHVPSYNEVLLEHRQERVTRWRAAASHSGDSSSSSSQAATMADVAVPIHTLCQILASITNLQDLAENYEWKEMRTALHTAPVSDLETAASSLRQWDPDAIIGFDWGSCAWRHCGALADAQEAVDELDSLLGVLQPYEALFCLDVLERSVRDMLATVPWQQADAVDVQFWKDLPKYQPHQSTNVQYDESDPDTGENYIVDEAYVKALFELRVE